MRLFDIIKKRFCFQWDIDCYLSDWGIGIVFNIGQAPVEEGGIYFQLEIQLGPFLNRTLFEVWFNGKVN